jgi:hypothetical protein
MSHLLPCPACNRHIEAVESVCPFCAAPLPVAFAARPPRATPPRRLGRAALMAAGATLMGAAACNNNDAIGSGPKDASTVTTGTGGSNVGPVYGSPPITGTGGTIVAAYGGPIPTGGTFGTGGAGGTGGSAGAGGATDGAAPDAASDAGGASGRDAAQDRSVVALYGAAVPGDLAGSGSGPKN